LSGVGARGRGGSLRVDTRAAGLVGRVAGGACGSQKGPLGAAAAAHSSSSGGGELARRGGRADCAHQHARKDLPDAKFGYRAPRMLALHPLGLVVRSATLQRSTRL
jgi:hypothetical protein